MMASFICQVTDSLLAGVTGLPSPGVSHSLGHLLMSSTQAHIIHTPTHIIQQTYLVGLIHVAPEFPRATRRQVWSAKHFQTSAYVTFAEVPLSNVNHMINLDLRGREIRTTYWWEDPPSYLAKLWIWEGKDLWPFKKSIRPIFVQSRNWLFLLRTYQSKKGTTLCYNGWPFSSPRKTMSW